MVNDDRSQYDDEIDLAALVRSLWEGKWLVIAVTSVALLLAAVYLILIPKTYEASLDIETLPKFQANEFTELNGSGFLAIDEEILMSRFLEEIQSNEAFKIFIASNDYITQQPNETNGEFSFRIRKTANKFVIGTSDSGEFPHPVLRFTTSNPTLASLVVEDALELANKKVNTKLLSAFTRHQNERSRETEFALEDIDVRKRLALTQYQLEIKARLALLDEKATIARKLGIEKPSLITQTYSGLATKLVNSPLITTVGNESPMYLRGYAALEKEMAVIETRMNPETFVPSLVWLEVSKARLVLTQNSRLTQAKIILANTPIGRDQFIAANYDLSSLDYKSTRKVSLILTLTLFLGGVLGCFVLLIHNLLNPIRPTSTQ